MSSSRRSTYKLPPSSSTLTSLQQSQAARRDKALEEQKRKRALKFDLSRFASLKLGDDEDEDEEGDEEGGEEPNQDVFKVVHSGIADFTSAMNEPLPEDSVEPTESLPTQKTKLKPKTKTKKKKGRKRASSNAQWADKIMYAELLEMPHSEVVASAMDLDTNGYDGLPADLHTSWVALSPVPVGKRCLAITRDGPGRNPIPRSRKPRSPRDNELNTSLRSRLHGKHISLFPGASSSTNSSSDKSDSWFFPSALPPSTILDCILDENWTRNGVLHVLDVLRWKGQEVGECEAGMRFWWRDTRLNELSAIPLPSQSYQLLSNDTSHSTSLMSSDSSSTYTYPYPTTLLPVPYHAAPLSLSTLLNTVVPAARSTRSVRVSLPMIVSTVSKTSGSGDMDIDTPTCTTTPATTPIATREHSIIPDGLLLYVAEASYESGTSPLSNWVPLRQLSSASKMESESMEDVTTESSHAVDTPNLDGPLDQFERLLRLRVQRQGMSS
ncbi:hypothetical protein EV361DRAFT_924883 [Lentinula raphanica]|nr:hypothetical protein EV361DRAFT_924883 [Lentinula raphanica]